MSPQAVDFNNDGLDDLIVGERYGFVNYFRRLSDGSLTSEGRIQDGNSDLYVGRNSAPVVFDWNNDGLLDLIVGRESHVGGSVWLFINQGSAETAVFDGYSTVMNGSSPIAWSRGTPQLEDMNGDGLSDFVITESYGKTHYLENSGSIGSPVFDGSSPVTVNGTVFSWGLSIYSFVAVADWNEDGIMDLVEGNKYNNLWLFLGKPPVSVENTNSLVPEDDFSLEIASNPARNSLNYTVFSEQPVHVVVTLWALDGRMVCEWDLGVISGSSIHVNSIEELPAGIYSVVSNVNGRIEAEQVAVVR